MRMLGNLEIAHSTDGNILKRLAAAGRTTTIDHDDQVSELRESGRLLPAKNILAE